MISTTFFKVRGWSVSDNLPSREDVGSTAVNNRRSGCDAGKKGRGSTTGPPSY
jgi:hypothetical protein